MKTKHLSLILLGILLATQAKAYDALINRIYYNVNTVTMEATVTSGTTKYSGSYTIPESIIHQGQTYAVTAIAQDAFNNCPDLTSVTIEGNITTIGKRAFVQCTKLESINLPSSLTEIGESAFSGCKVLPSISIPYGVETISRSAFSGCEKLTSVNIPSSVTAIGWGAFAGCSVLADINIPDGVTSIGGKAFTYCKKITSMAIPNSVTVIGDSAFYECQRLETVNLPNQLTAIKSYTFYNCSSLSSIEIPSSVETIEKYAFYSCFAYSSLSPINIVFPQGVTTIGNYAFSGSKIQTLTMSSSVSSIGTQAFSGCSLLSSITSHVESPFTFGSYAFSSISSSCTLTVPYGTTDAYIAAGWTTSIFNGGITEMPDLQSITIGSAGIATFCSTKNLDFSGTDDIKAYIVSTFTPSTGEVTLTRVTDVPANTGLVLKGAEGTYDIPVGTGETVMANMLVGVTNDTQLNKEDGEYTNYILAKKSGETGFFVVTNGSTLGANKAYLPLPTASLPSSAKIRVIFEDEAATGIETTIEPEATQDEGIYYNLQGQRVEQPTRGIYIVNGKKIWIK